MPGANVRRDGTGSPRRLGNDLQERAPPLFALSAFVVSAQKKRPGSVDPGRFRFQGIVLGAGHHPPASQFAQPQVGSQGTSRQTVLGTQRVTV